LIGTAGVPLKAMILLGLNAGFGAGDCSELPKAAVQGAWIDFRRPKTGAPRRVPLWPETVKALKAVLATRPDAADVADDHLVFLTRFGKRFVRYTPSTTGKPGTRKDSVIQEFRKVAEDAGVELPGGFYVLRHVFRTVADEARDPVATGLLMGHTDDSLAGQYREAIDDARLKAVVKVVREWMYNQ
jgi:integrase